MPLLSIVIPVYNERNTIEATLRQVVGADLPEGISREVIIIDDCSTDGTRELLGGSGRPFRVFFHERRQGKGAAVRDGIRASSGDYIVIQDADQEYDPREYSSLLGPILAKQADAVYGSRFLAGRPRAGSRFWHYAGNRILTAFSNAFTHLQLTDMETCYKMFTRRVADEISPKLVSDRFEIEPEITARIAKAGFRVLEVGISYHGRSYAEGKKIGWKDGIEAVYYLIKYRFTD